MEAKAGWSRRRVWTLSELFNEAGASSSWVSSVRIGRCVDDDNRGEHCWLLGRLRLESSSWWFHSLSPTSPKHSLTITEPRCLCFPLVLPPPPFPQASVVLVQQWNAYMTPCSGMHLELVSQPWVFSCQDEARQWFQRIPQAQPQALSPASLLQASPPPTYLTPAHVLRWFRERRQKKAIPLDLESLGILATVQAKSTSIMLGTLHASYLRYVGCILSIRDRRFFFVQLSDRTLASLPPTPAGLFLIVEDALCLDVHYRRLRVGQQFTFLRFRPMVLFPKKETEQTVLVYQQGHSEFDPCDHVSTPPDNNIYEPASSSLEMPPSLESTFSSTTTTTSTLVSYQGVITDILHLSPLCMLQLDHSYRVFAPYLDAHTWKFLRLGCTVCIFNAHVVFIDLSQEDATNSHHSPSFLLCRYSSLEMVEFPDSSWEDPPSSSMHHDSSSASLALPPPTSAVDHIVMWQLWNLLQTRFPSFPVKLHAMLVPKLFKATQRSSGAEEPASSTRALYDEILRHEKCCPLNRYHHHLYLPLTPGILETQVRNLVDSTETTASRMGWRAWTGTELNVPWFVGFLRSRSDGSLTLGDTHQKLTVLPVASFLSPDDLNSFWMIPGTAMRVTVDSEEETGGTGKRISMTVNFQQSQRLLRISIAAEEKKSDAVSGEASGEDEEVIVFVHHVYRNTNNTGGGDNSNTAETALFLDGILLKPSLHTQHLPQMLHLQPGDTCMIHLGAHSQTYRHVLHPRCVYVLQGTFRVEQMAVMGGYSRIHVQQLRKVHLWMNKEGRAVSSELLVPLHPDAGVLLQQLVQKQVLQNRVWSIQELLQDPAFLQEKSSCLYSGYLQMTVSLRGVVVSIGYRERYQEYPRHFPPPRTQQQRQQQDGERLMMVCKIGDPLHPQSQLELFWDTGKYGKPLAMLVPNLVVEWKRLALKRSKVGKLYACAIAMTDLEVVGWWEAENLPQTDPSTIPTTTAGIVSSATLLQIATTMSSGSHYHRQRLQQPVFEINGCLQFIDMVAFRWVCIHCGLTFSYLSSPNDTSVGCPNRCRTIGWGLGWQQPAAVDPLELGGNVQFQVRMTALVSDPTLEAKCHFEGETVLTMLNRVLTGAALARVQECCWRAGGELVRSQQDSGGGSGSGTWVNAAGVPVVLDASTNSEQEISDILARVNQELQAWTDGRHVQLRVRPSPPTSSSSETSTAWKEPLSAYRQHLEGYAMRKIRVPLLAVEARGGRAAGWERHVELNLLAVRRMQLDVVGASVTGASVAWREEARGWLEDLFSRQQCKR